MFFKMKQVDRDYRSNKHTNDKHKGKMERHCSLIPFFFRKQIMKPGRHNTPDLDGLNKNSPDDVCSKEYDSN